MKTYSEIIKEKGPKYMIGFTKAKRSELTERKLAQIRRVFKEELEKIGKAQFRGEEYDMSKLEIYVGYADGFNLWFDDLI